MHPSLHAQNTHSTEQHLGMQTQRNTYNTTERVKHTHGGGQSAATATARAILHYGTWHQFQLLDIYCMLVRNIEERNIKVKTSLSTSPSWSRFCSPGQRWDYRPPPQPSSHHNPSPQVIWRQQRQTFEAHRENVCSLTRCHRWP